MMIAARKLSFARHKEQLLADIEFDIPGGQVCGVIGPSGAGKTTLLRLLIGLFAPTHGEVVLGEKPLTDYKAAERARKMAWVPQQLRADFPFTTRELVLMGRMPHLRPFALGGHADDALAEEALATLELETIAARTLPQLSGGELRRAYLARALVQQTPLLLLDEPTAGLDLRHLALLGKMMRGQAERGNSVIVVLHDLHMAKRVCDRLLLLDHGRLVADGPAPTVLGSDLLCKTYGVTPETLGAM